MTLPRNKPERKLVRVLWRRLHFLEAKVEDHRLGEGTTTVGAATWDTVEARAMRWILRDVLDLPEPAREAQAG